MRVVKDFGFTATFVISAFLFSNCVPQNKSELMQAENQQMMQKCQTVREWFYQINRGADEFSQFPKKTELVKEPYIKGKLIILRQNRKDDKYKHQSGISLPEECKKYRNSYDNVKYGSEDELQDIRARTSEEIQTIVFLECKPVSGGFDLYRKEGTVIPISGIQETCTMFLVDKTIPAVIYKKTFDSEKLKSVETVEKDTIAVYKRVEDSQINQFLLSLPHR